ncbi:MAG: hypothetical protein FWC03_02190 [Treponema sp.]|nr:hypothetical protein [Treponema sp.]
MIKRKIIMNNDIGKIKIIFFPLAIANYSLSIIRRSAFFVLCFLFFVTCKTSPKVTDEEQLHTTVPLDSGASVYLFADINEMRFILDLLPVAELNSKQVKQMLDKTGYAAAALFPKESGRQYQVTAWGNYPSSGAAMAFNFSREWKRQRAQQGFTYWFSASNMLSVALNASRIFAASWLKTPDNNNPVAAAAGVEYPEGFADFRRNSPFSCWFNDPEPLINEMLDRNGIPIMIPAKKLYINLSPSQESASPNGGNSSEKKQYKAELKFQFESVSLARNISTALTYAAMFLPVQGEGSSANNSFFILTSILFANPPEQEGSYINIKTASLGETDIALLIGLFMAGREKTTEQGAENFNTFS